MKLRLGLGLSDQRASAAPVEPPSDILLSNSTVAEDLAVGMTIGRLTVVGSGSLEILTDLDNKFLLDGRDVNLEAGLDYETKTSHVFTARAENAAGFFDREFTVTVTDVDEDTAPPIDPETVTPIFSGGFDVEPVFGKGNGKGKGQGKTNALASVVYSIGAVEAGTAYIMRYVADFSLLSNQGKNAFVGFIMKDGNNFHGVGLKGDGSTTGEDPTTIQGNWNALNGVTITDKGTNANGTQYTALVKIAFSGDGATYTYSTGTGSDPETAVWTDEVTNQSASNILDLTAAETFGPAIFFPANDVGQFSIEITAWAVVDTTKEISLRIPSGAVASNLSNFPVKVDLSQLPDSFWSAAKSDGGDVRVRTTGGTVIPHDLVWFDKTNKLGELYFLASSILAGSDNDWLVTSGDGSLSKLAATDSNGRNAVWASFKRFFNFYENTDRTGSGNDATVTGEDESWVVTKYWRHYNIHQGVAVDGDYLILIDTDFMLKITKDGKIVRHVSGTLAAAGISGGHIGDGCVHGNYLYAGGVNSAGTASYLIRFNKDTLAYVDKFDISTQSASSAPSVAYNPDDGLIYRCTYTGNALHGYNATTGAYVGSITLGSSGGTNLYNGLTFFQGKIYLHSEGAGSNDGRIYRWLLNGTFDREIMRHTPTGLVAEGLDHDADGLYFVKFQSPSGTAGYVSYARPVSEALPSALSFYGAGKADITVPKLTAWTMGASFEQQFDAGQTYIDYGGGGNGEKLAYQSSSDGIGSWNTTDSWLMVPPIVQCSRYQSIAISHNGTTERKAYAFGIAATDATVAAMPAGTGTSLRVGQNLSNAEPVYGPMNEVYLYDGVLSDAFLAAWYNNRERPWWFIHLLDDDGSVVYPHSLTLSNPGGEAGAMTGWSQINSSGLGSIGSGALHSGGNYFILSATVATPWWGQTIVVPAGVQSDIDAGLLEIEAAVYVRGADADLDLAQLLVDCYDGSSNWLGGTQSPWLDSSQVERAAIRSLCPAGTRNIRISVRGWRITGTECSVYVDDFELTLHRAEGVSDADVVTSLEVGSTTGWTNSSGSLSTGTLSWGETGINGGSNAATVGYKDFSLPAGMATAIAAGRARLNLYGSVGNTNGDDTINVSLQFRTSGGSLIGSAVNLSANAAHMNPAGRQTGAANGAALIHPIFMKEAVPTNAASVRVTLSYSRVDGTVLDAGICRLALICTDET